MSPGMPLASSCASGGGRHKGDTQKEAATCAQVGQSSPTNRFGRNMLSSLKSAGRVTPTAFKMGAM